MQTKSYEFLHHGIKHKVFNRAALNLINIGIEINDDYLDGIFEFINPATTKISDTDYLRLFFQDYYNRMIYDKKDGFGNILEYDKKLLQSSKMQNVLRIMELVLINLLLNHSIITLNSVVVQSYFPRSKS